MKRYINLGIIIISAIALSSCSTPNQLSSASKNNDDDMYNTVAKAGDAPVYVNRPVYRDENEQSSDGYVDDYYTNDDDYYYYDDYASRINRFGYASPFGYYDNLYYGYQPYGPGWNVGMGYGYGGYGGGWGLNIGFGGGWGGYGGGWGGYGGYGYSPWGYGYGGYGGGLGYSYYGTGWGGYPYWGAYSAYNSNPRPYRGAGIPAGGYRNGGGLSGRPASATGIYSGRPVNGTYGRRPTSTPGGRPATTVGRPQRDAGTPTARPAYEPRPTYNPPSNSGGSSFGGGRSSGGGGGGGGRSSGGRGRN